MVQQYLPPALMLEQLRNERYRQAAQGMQQGLNQALQTYMSMEQLKQAAAEKKAERDERARQFNEMQKYRDAQLAQQATLDQRLRDIQTRQADLAQARETRIADEAEKAREAAAQEIERQRQAAALPKVVSGVYGQTGPLADPRLRPQIAETMGAMGEALQGVGVGTAQARKGREQYYADEYKPELTARGKEEERLTRLFAEQGYDPELLQTLRAEEPELYRLALGATQAGVLRSPAELRGELAQMRAAETEAKRKAQLERSESLRRFPGGRAKTPRGGTGDGLAKEKFISPIQREANSRRATRVAPLYALAQDFEAKAEELLAYTKNKYDEKSIAPTQEERDQAAEYKIRAEQLREQAQAEDDKITAFFNEKLMQYGLPQQQMRPAAQYEMPQQSMITAEQLAEVQNQPDLRDRLTEVKTPRNLAEAKTEAAEIAARGDATTQEELNAWLEKNAGSREAKLIEQDLKRYFDLGLKMDEAVNLIGRDYLGKNWLQKGAREMVMPRLDSLLKGAQKL